MADRWKAGTAFIYTMVVLIDLLVLPFYYQNRDVDLSEIEIAILSEATVKDKMEYLKAKKHNYKPITTDTGSVVHFAFAVILGAGAMNRRKQNDDKSNRSS